MTPKRFFLSFALIFVFLPTLLLHAQTNEIISSTEEHIEKFDTTIVVSKDSTINVAENITYHFADGDEKHGIFRDIPIVYKSSLGTKFKLDISNIQVTDENAIPYQFTTSKIDGGDTLEIKIGDPNSLIIGTHVYDIKYQVSSAIGYFNDFDEIYWNATGNEWPYPIASVHQSVILPTAVSKDSLRVSCYYGPLGSTSSCTNSASVNELNGNTKIDFNFGSSLGVNEGVTVAVGFLKGIVRQPTRTENFEKMIKDNAPLFALFLLPLIVFVVMLRFWLKYGRDPKGSGVIIPQYESPDELTPLEVASIMREKIKGADVSAELIQLAIQGYIYIKKDDEYVLTLQKEIDDSLNEADREIIKGVFSEDSSKGSTVSLSDLEDSFYKTLASVNKMIWNSSVQRGYFSKMQPVVSTAVLRSSLMFFVILVIGIFIHAPFLIFSAIISFIIVFIFNYIMTARTKKGVDAREHILGLKLYLEIAEKDRINFHNAPEKKPELFEKFLPYAMVLGVEKAWAKQFEGIYTSKPSWYSDSSMNAFNAGMFVNNLQDFRSESSKTLSSSPSSSSGSGGGGSSGGGGGGGGGGSW